MVSGPGKNFHFFSLARWNGEEVDIELVEEVADEGAELE